LKILLKRLSESRPKQEREDTPRSIFPPQSNIRRRRNQRIMKSYTLYGLLCSNGFTSISNNLVQKIGLSSAYFLSVLMKQHLYFHDRGFLDENDGFHFRESDRENIIGLCPNTQRHIILKLTLLGLITTTRKGEKGTLFFYLNPDAIEALINDENPVTQKVSIRSCYAKSEYPVTQKLRNTIVRTKEEEEKKNNLSFDRIVALWNLCMKETEVPQILKLSNARKNKLKSRTKDLTTYDVWKKLFLKIKSTPFLMGENNRKWKISFDWVIENDANYVKVLEGAYLNASDKEPEDEEKEARREREQKRRVEKEIEEMQAKG
jgi:hypothetical protein